MPPSAGPQPAGAGGAAGRGDRPHQVLTVRAGQFPEGRAPCAPHVRPALGACAGRRVRSPALAGVSGRTALRPHVLHPDHGEEWRGQARGSSSLRRGEGEQRLGRAFHGLFASGPLRGAVCRARVRGQESSQWLGCLPRAHCPQWGARETHGGLSASPRGAFPSLSARRLHWLRAGCPWPLSRLWGLGTDLLTATLPAPRTGPGTQ